MFWKMPPKIKIYEALGAIADGRIEVADNEASVWSSSGNKFYAVIYDPDKKAIMTNDNGSYWQGYLGYPAISYLLVTGVLTYDSSLAESMKGILWKDVNTKFKNDFFKTEQYVLDRVGQQGGNTELVEKEVGRILADLEKLHLEVLGKKIKPPTGY